MGKVFGKFTWHSFVFHISQIYLYMIAACILIVAPVLLLGGSVGAFLLPASFAAALLLTAAFYDGKPGKQFIFEILTAIILMVIFAWFSAHIYDTSWDGNDYHKLAVGLLKNGWNPIYQSTEGQVMQSVVGVPSLQQATLWADCYCKVTWFFASSIYVFTGNIESTKIYTLMIIACAFGFTYYYMKKAGKGTWACWIMSLAAMLNPIAVQQLDSFYVDGFLHLVLYILVITLMVTAKRGIVDLKVSGSLVAAGMIICGNIKFTGLMYGGVFCVVYYVWYVINQFLDKNENRIKNSLIKCLEYAVLAIVTVVWAGSSSYMTNLVNYKNPLYPLAGADKVDIMTRNTPFYEVNHLHNFMTSLFSRVDNFLLMNGDREPVLKMPFSVDLAYESLWGESVDPRLSGFGIFFSGLFVVSVIIIVIGLVRMKKDRDWVLWLLNLAVCGGLTLAITENWWARYTPCLYFILLIAIYMLLDTKRLLCNAISGAMLIALVINNYMFVNTIPSQWGMSDYVSELIEAMNSGDGEVRVYSSYYPGIYFNLIDNDVDYTIDETLADEPDAYNLAYNYTYQDMLWKPCE